ncbi:sensor histidine kinase [Candidatus Omnitrophota bacterium]
MVKIKARLPVKFILIISVILILTLWPLSSYFISNQKIQLQAALKNKGRSLARNLAYISEQGVLTENKELLLEFAQGLLKEEDVVYCLVQDNKAEVLVSAGLIEPSQIFKEANRDIKQELEREEPRIRFYLSDQGEPIYDIATLIVTQWIEKRHEEIAPMGPGIEGLIEENIGVARVGVSLFNTNQQIDRLRKMAVLWISVVVGIGALVAVFLVKIIVNPVRQLVLGTQRIAKGDLAYQVKVSSNDEIGELTQSFNKMAQDLKKFRDKIEDYNRTLEQKVDERTKELRETQAQLIQSAKMGAVGQLGAGVAHELNNPLAGILGYAQFILDKFRRPEFGVNDLKACQRYVGSMEREAVRCKKIVENLLKFSRRPVLAQPEPLNIAKAIEEVLLITFHQLRLKNIRLITDIKPNLSEVVGVFNQLQQVFTNLILNAQQAMTDGGELKITAENIVDQRSQAPTGVKIEFIDTGYGIPPENLARIFEPFFTTKQKEKGTGLGLSVSYGIIQDHKGSLDVKSEVNKGTTFIIILPAAIKK